MKKSILMAIIVLIIIALFITAAVIYTNKDDKQDNATEISDEISNINFDESINEFSNLKDESIIAYINGEAIYKYELDRKEYSNKIIYELAVSRGSDSELFNKTREELLEDLIKSKIISAEVKKAGITISEEEVKAKIIESNEKMKHLAEIDHPGYKEKLQEQEEILAKLKITEEEFINEFSLQLEMEITIKSKHISLFFKNEYDKKANNSDYEIKDYNLYIDELFQNSDYEILE